MAEVIIGLVVGLVGLVVCIVAIVLCVRCCCSHRDEQDSLQLASYHQREALLASHQRGGDTRQMVLLSRSAAYASDADAAHHFVEHPGQFTRSEKDHLLSDTPPRAPVEANTILRVFGYEFNEDGKLVDAETGLGFVFKDQEHYEQLGQAINEYIYQRLELELERKKLPAPSNVHRGFYFASKDVTTNRNGLLVLIHGTGNVRAGQWSRRLIINHSLDSGSQLPYIQRAKANGWSVVVMNTNQRGDYSDLEGWIEGSNPEDHGCAVWKAAVRHSPAKAIGIVAHSYGGHVTSCLIRSYNADFKDRVAAIALTDSSCSVSLTDQSYFSKVARNWTTSSLPLDRRVGYGYNCEYVSAGTTVHEETSWKSIGPVFAFVENQFRCRGVEVNTADESAQQVVVTHHRHTNAKRPAEAVSGSPPVSFVGEAQSPMGCVPVSLPVSSTACPVPFFANPESISKKETAHDFQVLQEPPDMHEANELHLRTQDQQDLMHELTVSKLDEAQSVDQTDVENASCRLVQCEGSSVVQSQHSSLAPATGEHPEISEARYAVLNSSADHSDHGINDADASLQQPEASLYMESLV